MVWISSLQVESYSSFEASGEIRLSPHFNIIAGTNNSGKSSLLKCLHGQISENPHKSPARFRPGELRGTVIDMTLETSTEEVRTILAYDEGRYQLPYSRQGDGAGDIKRAMVENIPWRMRVRRGIAPQYALRDNDGIPWRLDNVDIGNIRVKEGDIAFGHGSSNEYKSIANVFNSSAYPTIFRFDPQRTPPSKTSYGQEGILQPNGANLPRVLNYLQNREPDRFSLIVRNLDEIIGNIASITTPPAGSDVEIRIWPTSDTSNFALSFDLDRSGTGVAQTLCLLTAASSVHPSVIIVDEINSHLHPEAVRRFLLILSSYYSHHQYIISSHSPDVIGRSDAAKLFLVEREGFSSSVEEIDLSKVEGLRRVAGSLGVSLADALGADRMLWVEGPTEEEVFSKIYREQGGSLPLSVRISRVSDTGLFESRATKKSVTRVFQHVAATLAPTVSKMRFCLDRENKTDEAVKEAEQATQGRVRFLPRRNIECYVLDPPVIADVLAPLLSRPHADVEAAILNWIEQHGGDVDLGSSRYWNGNISSDDWRKHIDGAKVLSRLFSTVTENTHEFRKTLHTPQLFIAAAKRATSDYKALASFVSALFKPLLS